MDSCAAIKMSGIDYNPYLTPGVTNIVGVTTKKENTHYLLPGQFNEAKQAFIEYFRPEFKKGDIVVILSDKDGSVNSSGDIGEIISVNSVNIQVNCGRQGSGCYQGFKNVRPATEEEIRQYKEEKITVAGYEMKVVDYLVEKAAKFCDQGFTIDELKAYRKLLELNRYVFVHIRIEDTPITTELLDKIINKLQ
jgi:hypothetical protein